MIYLVRHTSVAVPSGLCYGRSDVPLADSYPEEFENVRAKLPEDLRYFSSPASRCLTLARDLSSDVQVDDRLQELDFGAWEMRPWDTLGPEAVQWGEHFVTMRCPSGESFADLEKRVLAFWQQLIMRETDKSLAIITHAGVIRAILAHVQHKPLARAFSIEVGYGQVIPLFVP